jgi:hypothetical protein
MTRQANRHIFLALSSPRPGREAEFNRWYEEHHLEDVVRFVPGFVRGRRYVASPHQLPGQIVRWHSLAIYDLEATDVRSLHDSVRANVAHFTPSNGVFEKDHVAWVYTPMAASSDPARLQDPGELRSTPGVILAFSEQALVIPAGDALHAARPRHFQLHADQRPGTLAPWHHLAILDPLAELDDARWASEPALRALWRFERVGREVGDTARS